MNILKFAAIGAAVGLGVHYITKKDEHGRSILDDLADKAPDLFNQAKKFATETVDQVKQHIPRG
jgi:hypothetical protein